MRVKDIFGGIPILYMYIVYLNPICKSISLYVIVIFFLNYYTLLLEVGYPSGYILQLHKHVRVCFMFYGISIVYIIYTYTVYII